MDAGRWERIAEIYDAVRDLPVTERASFLENVCRGDQELRGEIESLLSQNVSADGPIEQVADDVEKAFPHPGSIGRYRILRLIGEGAMGAVYEAEQDHPRRTVALKLLKCAMAAPGLSRRFALESEALGRLQHPGVARIYEAGVDDTPLGPQPYFAMELIRGLPLIEYANREKLDTRRRLELMIRICDAVEHAHQRGIIHRDLKPANILVDETGQPKILDFGVARMTDDDASATSHTSLGDLLGTMAYMSPEQFLGDPAALDSRSDIYALGVILYELLAGRRPYELPRNAVEAAKVVCEQEPASLGGIRKEYREDLEAIVAKALEKDKARRYGSAAELAADIRRHLAHEPILAKAPSAAYQARKFVRRHRVLVSAAAAVFTVLLAGIVVSTWEAVRANRERDRALRAEQVAKAVNDFLQNDLLAQAGARAQASTHASPDPDLKVRTALDRAAARIAGKFDSQPAVEASIRRTIGLAYRDMNLFAEAQPHLERAAELRKRALGADHPDTLVSLGELGALYNLQAKYSLAEATLSQVLAAQRRILGSDHKETLATMAGLALVIVFQGDNERAAPMMAEVFESDRRRRGEEDHETLSVMDSLGCVYLRLGRFEEGTALQQREVQLVQRVKGLEHPSTAVAMHNLATGYVALGRYAEADKLFLAALDLRRRALGDSHWETQDTRLHLAISYRAQGRYAGAEELFRAAAEKLAQGLGAEHPLTLECLYYWGQLYEGQHRFVEAESLFVRVLEARRRIFGAENPKTAEALAALAELKLERKAYGEAETLLRESLRVRRLKVPNSWERYYTECMMGAAETGLGKLQEARALLPSAYDGLVQRQKAIPAEYQDSLDRARQWAEKVK
jgi:hypothetical protein